MLKAGDKHRGIPMQKNNGLKSLWAILLCTTPLLVMAESVAATATPPTSQNSDSKPGYSVDGRTSASVIAAKRSHAVSKDDETGLAIASGLIVIGVIVFFSQTLLNKK